MKLSKESRLLRYIFMYHGGYQEIANRYNISRQYVFAWVARGYVPTKRIRTLAKDLKVPTSALNFKAASEVSSQPLDFNHIIRVVKAALK